MSNAINKPLYPKEIEIGDLLAGFFEILEQRKIVYVLLRGYGLFPLDNEGRDLDVYISRGDLDSCIDILRDELGVEIYSIVGRDYVTSVYLCGVNWRNGPTLELDIVHKFSWKGLEYLDGRCLASMRQRLNDRQALCLVPCSAHEVLLNVVGPLLNYGKLDNPRASISLQRIEKSGDENGYLEGISKKLVECVRAALTDITGEKQQIVAGTLRKKLLMHAMKSPVTALVRFSSHMLAEIKLKLSSRHIYRIAVLGPDGAGKSTILEKCDPELAKMFNVVSRVHLKHTLWGTKRVANRGIVTEPHALASRGVFTSVAKVILWIIEAWLARFIRNEKQLSLEVYDRHFIDLLVDPKRYRFGGGATVVRLAIRLLPKIDCFFVIVASAKTIQSRKQEVSLQETERQLEEYHRLAADSRYQTVVINSDQSLTGSIHEFITGVRETILRDRLP